YIRLEKVFFAAPPPADLCRDVNTRFDQASLLFFSGQFGDAIRALNECGRRLRHLEDPSFDRLVVESVKVRVESPVGVRGPPTRPKAHVVSMYALRGRDNASPAPAGEVRLTLRARAAGPGGIGAGPEAGAIAFSAPITVTLTPDGAPIDVTLDIP